MFELFVLKQFLHILLPNMAKASRTYGVLIIRVVLYLKKFTNQLTHILYFSKKLGVRFAQKQVVTSKRIPLLYHCPLYW